MNIYSQLGQIAQLSQRSFVIIIYGFRDPAKKLVIYKSIFVFGLKENPPGRQIPVRLTRLPPDYRYQKPGTVRYGTIPIPYRTVMYSTVRYRTVIQYRTVR